MPRYVIPKGAYDTRQGGKFESAEIAFTIHVIYDQQEGDEGEESCEEFALNSNDAINDLSELGIYIDVGRPLRIDQTAYGGSDVDPVLTVPSAGAAQQIGGLPPAVPMVCEGYTCTESRSAKMWTITATYRAVSYEDPNHVEAIIRSAPRTTPAWRIGNTLAIDWTDTQVAPTGSGAPYQDLVVLNDIGGVPYDINTQPRQYVVDGLEAVFSFVIRAPYYDTHAATTLTVDELWSYWTEGDGSRTPGRRTTGVEWGESPVETWSAGEWVVMSVDIVPINSVDHKCTVTMKLDDFQNCDQIPAQAYGGIILPDDRAAQPNFNEQDVSVFLMQAKYVLWSNPYPLTRAVWSANDFPFNVYDYVSQAFTA
mgnify:CR=1 FL=1